MNEKQSNEPSLQDLEINVPRLPRDMYRSKFTWTVRHAFMKKQTCLKLLALFYGIYYYSNELNELNEMFAMLYRITLTFIVINGQYSGMQVVKNLSLHLEKRMDFLAEVIKIQPHVDMGKWDIIAANMNEFFYTKGTWHTKEFFFDGKHCHDVFKLLFVTPYSEKALKKNVPPYLELKPYVDQATKVCQPELDE